MSGSLHVTPTLYRRFTILGRLLLFFSSVPEKAWVRSLVAPGRQRLDSRLCRCSRGSAHCHHSFKEASRSVKVHPHLDQIFWIHRPTPRHLDHDGLTNTQAGATEPIMDDTLHPSLWWRCCCGISRPTAPWFVDVDERVRASDSQPPVSRNLGQRGHPAFWTGITLGRV